MSLRAATGWTRLSCDVTTDKCIRMRWHIHTHTNTHTQTQFFLSQRMALIARFRRICSRHNSSAGARNLNWARSPARHSSVTSLGGEGGGLEKEEEIEGERKRGKRAGKRHGFRDEWLVNGPIYWLEHTDRHCSLSCKCDPHRSDAHHANRAFVTAAAADTWRRRQCRANSTFLCYKSLPPLTPPGACSLSGYDFIQRSVQKTMRRTSLIDTFFFCSWKPIF